MESNQQILAAPVSVYFLFLPARSKNNMHVLMLKQALRTVVVLRLREINEGVHDHNNPNESTQDASRQS
jgi:ribosomal protein L30/L7E